MTGACQQIVQGVTATQAYQQTEGGTSMSGGETPTTTDLAVMLARIEGSVNLALANQTRNEADIKELEHEQSRQASTLAAVESRLGTVEATVKAAAPQRIGGWAIAGYVCAVLAVVLTIAERIYSK